ISMFIDEAKIAGHLTHANIVPIYELGKIGESHYIAMEYVWGKDLLQIMNRFRRMRRHMPPVMAAWIASKMLEGLDYAHRKRDRHGRPMGIIHRDVSPQNCLVSYEGQVKLIDFGIAKAASRNTKTQAGVLKGKFGYMSPEQVRGAVIDHRSDIFAASTCLHEMLTGERLFVGESDFSTLEKVRNAEVVPPSSMVADIPPELEEILMKGLARDPDDRWQTAGEMQEALQRFIALQRPPFGTSKLSTWMRTAFAPEIAKEKARLDMFAKVGHPGASTASAPQPRPSVPSPPSPAARKPPSSQPVASLEDFANVADLGDGDENELAGEATVISASPFEAMEEAGASIEDIAEQPTQIFFAAEELEELQEEAPAAPAGSLASAPPAAAKIPPPRPVGVPAPAPVPPPQPVGSVKPTLRLDAMGPPPGPAAAGPAPAAQTPAPAGQDMFAPPPPAQPAYPSQRNLQTMEVERPGQLRPAQTEKKSGMGKLIALLGLAAVLLVGALVVVTVVLFGPDPTGTISVRVLPAEAEARVFVDGVQRGRAPLLLEHVPEGTHEIEIRAEGFRSATRTVPVSEGSTAMLEILLERDPSAVAGPPALALAPAQAAAPTGVPVAAPVPPASAVPAVAPPAEAAAAPGTPTAPAPAAAPTAPVAPVAPAAAAASAAPAPREPERSEAARPSQTTRTESPRTEPAGSRTPQRVASGGDEAEARRPQRIREQSMPRRAESDYGLLTVQTLPWARVFVDGRDTGRNTPVRDLRVPAGRHTIGLRTNDGTMHTVVVTIEPGQTTRIVRQL
ncbi:MAG TPA: serine/threonine-protein kinase, partial [Sandaracinaceae bacterium]